MSTLIPKSDKQLNSPYNINTLSWSNDENILENNQLVFIVLVYLQILITVMKRNLRQIY